MVQTTTPPKTINCKFCASPLPPNSLVCTHCKQRNPISPLYATAKDDENKVLECVECHTPTMEFVDLGDYVESLTAEQCSGCQGIFIAYDVFEKTLTHYGLKRKNIPSKITMPKEKKRNQDGLYGCPVCSQTMKRFTYKISSSVLIDRCPKHGVWLNHGELRVLLEWRQSFKKFQEKEKAEEAYQKYGLKKEKSDYTYQKDYSTRFERFFEWLMGV